MGGWSWDRGYVSRKVGGGGNVSRYLQWLGGGGVLVDWLGMGMAGRCVG